MSAKRQVTSGLCLLSAIAMTAYARFVWGPAHGPVPGTIARVGKPLPRLPVVDASGRPVDAAKDAMGSRSVIAFYSASCRVCQVVLPQMRPFPPELRLFLINEESNDSLMDLGALGFEKAVLYRDPHRVLARSFPMCGVPTILFVDERGILRDGMVGEHARGQVQKKLREFARERP